MKKFIFSLIAIVFALSVSAQQTRPRFGVTKNEDNTGRVVTYGYLAPTVTATTVIAPNKYDNLYVLSTGTISPVVNFTTTASYVGDRVTIITLATGATSTVTLGGNVLTSASTYTVASTKKSTIQFVFDGSKFVEISRTTTQ